LRRIKEKRKNREKKEAGTKEHKKRRRDITVKGEGKIEDWLGPGIFGGQDRGERRT